MDDIRIRFANGSAVKADIRKADSTMAVVQNHRDKFIMVQQCFPTAQRFIFCFQAAVADGRYILLNDSGSWHIEPPRYSSF